MTPVYVFLATLAVFAAYMIGNLIGYQDCIKAEEKKKGIRQYSRQPFNERF